MTAMSPRGKRHVLTGKQLQTLAALGRFCGERVGRAARMCGEDPLKLSLMIGDEFLRVFGRIGCRLARTAEALDEQSWRTRRQLRGVEAHEQAGAAVLRTYCRSVFRMLDTFVANHQALLDRMDRDCPVQDATAEGEHRPSSDDVLRLVLDVVDARHLSHDRRVESFALWRNVLRRVKEADAMTKDESRNTQLRKAARFIAHIFYAQLVAAYDVSPRSALLSFRAALIQANTSPRDISSPASH